MYNIQSNAFDIAEKVEEWARGMTGMDDVAAAFWAWQTEDVNRDNPNMTVDADAVETIIPLYRRTRVRQRIAVGLRNIRGRPRGSWGGGARPRTLVREPRNPGVPQEKLRGVRPELMEKLEARLKDVIERRGRE